MSVHMLGPIFQFAPTSPLAVPWAVHHPTSYSDLAIRAHGPNLRPEVARATLGTLGRYCVVERRSKEGTESEGSEGGFHRRRASQGRLGGGDCLVLK